MKKEEWFHYPTVVMAEEESTQDKLGMQRLLSSEDLTFDSWVQYYKSKYQGSEKASELYSRSHLGYNLHHYFRQPVTYKVRKNKYDFLMRTKFKIMGNLIQAPFSNFVLCLPSNTLRTRAVTIFIEVGTISKLKQDEEFYVINKLVNQYNIKRYISLQMMESDGDATRTTMPIIEDMEVEQMLHVSNRTNLAKEDKNIFEIIIKTLLYLTTKNVDIQKELGITYALGNNPKKRRNQLRKMNMDSYTHYDIGRLYDNRVASTSSGQRGVGKNAACLVAGFYKAQWYGKKTEIKPFGTHQEVIWIDSYSKGLNPVAKTVEIIGS